ncbi:hypothetical protein BC940DRAFT_313704 [Gongronella butleri]|nr:hypothetical protein BC940DRAFT_313704 [Gongronella butleri]
MARLRLDELVALGLGLGCGAAGGSSMSMALVAFLASFFIGAALGFSATGSAFFFLLPKYSLGRTSGTTRFFAGGSTG